MIDIKELTKRFGQVSALNNVSVTIQAGEIVGLLGRNGAGKTTLMDLIVGLTSPTSGTVHVAGTSPREAVHQARIGAVFQTGGLLTDITVRDTVEMIASTHRDSITVQEALERARLTELQRRKVGACSGGEQQRLRYALALLGNPDVLILDEPTTGMDAAGRHEFWDAMRAGARDGRTIVFSTHYLEEAENFAERIVVLDHGEIIADSPTAELAAQAKHKRVQAQSSAGPIDETTADSDALARELLTTTDAHDLTITPRTLEEAFVELTSDRDGAADDGVRQSAGKENQR